MTDTPGLDLAFFDFGVSSMGFVAIGFIVGSAPREERRLLGGESDSDSDSDPSSSSSEED